MAAAQVLVDGEASEESEEEELASQEAREEGSASPVAGQQPSSTRQSPPDLLHRKLREKNLLLLRQLQAISMKPYTSAITSVNSLTDQMLVSRRVMEDVSLKLKKVTSDMRNLGVCLDHLSDVAASASSAVSHDSC